MKTSLLPSAGNPRSQSTQKPREMGSGSLNLHDSPTRKESPCRGLDDHSRAACQSVITGSVTYKYGKAVLGSELFEMPCFYVRDKSKNEGRISKRPWGSPRPLIKIEMYLRMQIYRTNDSFHLDTHPPTLLDQV